MCEFGAVPKNSVWDKVSNAINYVKCTIDSSWGSRMVFTEQCNSFLKYAYNASKSDNYTDTVVWMDALDGVCDDILAEDYTLSKDPKRAIESVYKLLSQTPEGKLAEHPATDYLEAVDTNLARIEKKLDRILELLEGGKL